uniref:Poly [ADP-ribose] polymerase n=1 Tax=Latimeria chalumnae TaxID=7897 RepID=H3A085_LATCH
SQPEDKLFSAEYAKSGRASCKKCGESIAKDSLRLAIMVQSPMFDGKVPHWHHYSCFWKRARVLSQGDINGFSNLRWEDQEKIKKAIETGGGAGDKGDQGGGGGKGEKTLTDFAVEYAKSNRSTCKGCNQKIEKDKIRVSKKMIDAEKPQLGMIDRWYHPDCFVSRRAELGFMPAYSATQLKGFSILKAEDKDDLKKKLPASKSEGKRMSKSMKGFCFQRKKKICLSGKSMQKYSTILCAEVNVRTSRILPCVSQTLSSQHVSSFLSLILKLKNTTPDGQHHILSIFGGGEKFKKKTPCKHCNKQLMSSSEYINCIISEAWITCSVVAATPHQPSRRIPRGLPARHHYSKIKLKKKKKIMLRSSLSKSFSLFSCLVLLTPPSSIRGGVPFQPPPPKSESSTLGNQSINQKEYLSLMLEIAGKRLRSPSGASLCEVTFSEIAKQFVKCNSLIAFNIFLVLSGKLQHVVFSFKKIQYIVFHSVQPWEFNIRKRKGGEVDENATSKKKPKKEKESKEEQLLKNEKRKSLYLKKKATSQKDKGLNHENPIKCKKKKIYIYIADISKPTSRKYHLESLLTLKASKYWVFRSWGRVGTTIGGNKLEKMPLKEDALEHFLNLYEEKTGNCWYSANFTKYPNKFYPLEIDYGQDEEAVKKLTASAGTKSKLPKAIQDIIKMIFDVESMKKAMVEFEIDLQKMPLGKLSKRQIQSAYSILNEVQQAVADGGSESQILDLSNRFYTLIPHDFGMKKPPLLNNLEYIQTKVQMLDNLLDIEVAYSLLRGGADGGEKDPIDVNYEKLKTDIKIVDKDMEEGKIILDYVSNTHAATHNAYDLEVLDIFKIEREGESQRYKPFQQLHNRQLLWHGSRTTNFAGILSQGLRIAPPEAPVTGYMFGKGVYFADMVSKSANYCHTSQADPVGLILLGEVALGNMYELKRANHITKLPKGKHSVKGLGRTGPDPGTSVMLDGVQVPLGKGTSMGIEDASLLYNEYIVYDIAQVNLKYLLKLKFNYKSSLW